MELGAVRPEDVLRIAAVGDIHCTRRSQGALRGLFGDMAAAADVLVFCGDLTDYGLPEEAHVLASELTAASASPVIAVLGNHDFESGKELEVRRILTDAGVTVLDGDTCDVRGVGFAGGFERALEAWGEPIIKSFVHESVNEALKLESALARLAMREKIAVLHYAPVPDTVEGEPREIFPFLGSRRLEEPLNRFAVRAVFHGHAHFGRIEGRTSAGIPVYNVAMPLLRRRQPRTPPFLTVDVPIVEEPSAEDSSAPAPPGPAPRPSP